MRDGMVGPMLVTPATVEIAEALAEGWPEMVRLSGSLLAPDVARRFGCSERMAFRAVTLAREIVDKGRRPDYDSLESNQG